MRNYHDPQIEAYLSEHCDVMVRQSNITPPHEETVKMAAECDGFLPEGIDIIDAEVLANASRLKVIGNRAVGTDNVDIPAATRNGILLTNTPGILQDACADMTFALLLSAARQVTRSDRAIRAGEWTVFDQTPYLGLDAYNKTLGIFGFGGIGQKVAKRAAGFDMRGHLLLSHSQARGGARVWGRVGGRFRDAAEGVRLPVPALPIDR